jgi:dihydroorotate dehydrogenase (fumarate)
MNLTTEYLGLRLRNPLIASASPLNGQLGALRELEDCGAAAVVLPSLFEERIYSEFAEDERSARLPASGCPEAQTYFPSHARPADAADRYLRSVQRAKAALDIPVVASLSCVRAECWRDYALQIQHAGADALELNLGAVPAAPELSGSEVEDACVQAVATVRRTVHIPIAVKLAPYFSSLGALARALCAAGADGLVLFNRFYQPDIDIRNLNLSLDIALSSAWEARLPLRWIALLHGRVPAALAASTGIDSPDDVYKLILAGADTVMTTSALLRHGIPHMRQLVNGLADLLAARNLDSPSQARGQMSALRLSARSNDIRANYVQMLQTAHLIPNS